LIESYWYLSTQTFVTVVTSGAGSAGVEAYRLRSYQTPRGGTDSAPTDYSWTVRQAARATSAAPLYFAPLAIDSQVFQDAGASGFNNPASEALQEAELLWSTKKHEFMLFSLGTGLASLLPDNSNLDNLLPILTPEILFKQPTSYEASLKTLPLPRNASSKLQNNSWLWRPIRNSHMRTLRSVLQNGESFLFVL